MDIDKLKAQKEKQAAIKVFYHLKKILKKELPEYKLETLPYEEALRKGGDQNIIKRNIRLNIDFNFNYLLTPDEKIMHLIMVFGHEKKHAHELSYGEYPSFVQQDYCFEEAIKAFNKPFLEGMYGFLVKEHIAHLAGQTYLYNELLNSKTENNPGQKVMEILFKENALIYSKPRRGIPGMFPFQSPTFQQEFKEKDFAKYVKFAESQYKNIISKPLPEFALQKITLPEQYKNLTEVLEYTKKLSQNMSSFTFPELISLKREQQCCLLSILKETGSLKSQSTFDKEFLEEWLKKSEESFRENFDIKKYADRARQYKENPENVYNEIFLERGSEATRLFETLKEYHVPEVAEVIQLEKERTLLQKENISRPQNLDNRSLQTKPQQSMQQRIISGLDYFNKVRNKTLAVSPEKNKQVEKPKAKPKKEPSRWFE